MLDEVFCLQYLCFGYHLKSISKKPSRFRIPSITLVYFVLWKQHKNKTQQKNKNPTKKLFQGIKSFGLDRIIDIWILLQPEEERKRRKYPPGHGTVDRSTLVTRDGRRMGLFWVRVLTFLLEKGGANGTLFPSRLWYPRPPVFGATDSFSRSFFQECKFLSLAP